MSICSLDSLVISRNYNIQIYKINMQDWPEAIGLCNEYAMSEKLGLRYYRYHKIRKAFSNIYRRHFDIVSKYNVGLKTLLLQGLSKPEFYGDLVYKFRKIISKNDFPYHFKKIIVRYKKIGYNIDVLRHTACLVVNPIKVNSFAYLFNCTLNDGTILNLTYE